MGKFGVILPAAGKSVRFRDQFYKKVYAPLAGRAVWMHAAERFVNRPDVAQVVIVIADEDREEFDRKFAANVTILGIDVVTGGKERTDSVAAGLSALKDTVTWVAIHDAARPCIADRWINNVFQEARSHGAAILAVPVTSTLKRVDANDQVAETVDRTKLWQAQTPQVFRRDWLEAAYQQRGDLQPTDESQLVEQAGHEVRVVQGSPLNLKITAREDLKLAELFLKGLPKAPAGGTAHPFADDDLWR